MSTSPREFRLGKPLVGPRRTLRWASSTVSKNNPGKTFWVIETLLRKGKLLAFLKERLLRGEASQIEIQCILDEPGTLRDQLFYNSLLAKNNLGVPLDILRPRMKTLSSVFGLISPLSESKYQEWLKRFPILIREYDNPTRPPKKFSGYVRNASSVGSKRRTPRAELLTEDTLEEYFSEFNFLEYLAVGELMGRSVTLKHPDEGSKKIRNGKVKKKEKV